MFLKETREFILEAIQRRQLVSNFRGEDGKTIFSD